MCGQVSADIITPFLSGEYLWGISGTYSVLTVWASSLDPGILVEPWDSNETVVDFLASVDGDLRFQELSVFGAT